MIRRKLGLGLERKIRTKEMFLSQALIIVANLCLLKICAAVPIYELISVRGYGVPFHFSLASKNID